MRFHRLHALPAVPRSALLVRLAYSSPVSMVVQLIKRIVDSVEDMLVSRSTASKREAPRLRHQNSWHVAASGMYNPRFPMLHTVLLILDFIFRQIPSIYLHKSCGYSMPSIKACQLLLREQVGDWLGLSQDVDASTISCTRRTETSSDLHVRLSADDRAHGRLSVSSPTSLRRSLAKWFDAELRPFSLNTDPRRPEFFVHGWYEPIDLTGSADIWTSHASVSLWATALALSRRLTNGTQYISLCATADATDPRHDASAWSADEDRAGRPVIGYVYLLEIPHAEAFYADKEPAGGLCTFYARNDHTFAPSESDVGLIGARIGYRPLLCIGAPSDRPDAFIFTERTRRESGLRVKHTYRIMNPMRPAVGGK